MRRAVTQGSGCGGLQQHDGSDRMMHEQQQQQQQLGRQAKQAAEAAGDGVHTEESQCEDFACKSNYR